MSDSESRLEHRAEERVDWSQVSHIHFRTAEQQLLDRRLDKINELRQILPIYLEVLRYVTATPELGLTATQQRTVQDVVKWLHVYDQLFSQEIIARDLSQPEAEALRVTAAVQLSEVKLNRPVDDLLEGGSSNLPLVEEWVQVVDRPLLVTTSDSHTTAAYMLQAAENGGYDLSHSAVLSFDHHTDLVDSAATGLHKGSVMSHILDKTQLPALAVVGPLHATTGHKAPFGKSVDIVTGKDLYTAGHLPDKAKYTAYLRDILARWQEMGITQIYPSIDLDGLRLTQQVYTATDYNSLDLMKREFFDEQLQDLADQTLHGIGLQRQSAASEFVALLEMHMDAKGFSPYQGLPASWIGLALDMATKEYGFTIGIKHPNKPSKIVGDIVEYTPPDHQGRTAKITKALLTRLVGVAQAGR
ncbi:MAG: arginase family protein [Candidatus Kerfeldbacteria bacterium]|nr:arginase family protein [Candidatus Kerfeldbacteria bacterium]